MPIIPVSYTHLQHLLKLAEEGATLIFIENYPEDVPGYGQLEKRRKNFAGWRKQLPSISTFDSTLSTPYQKGTIITGKDYGAALAKSLVFPEEMKVLHGLQYIRRSNDKGYHYFIDVYKRQLMNRMIYDASLPEEKRVTYAYPAIVSEGDPLVASGLKEVKIVRESRD